MSTIKHISKISDLSKDHFEKILSLALDMKKNPSKYNESLKYKTLLMFFEKPSLRTRVSLEVGMTQLGGHAIYYNISTGPLGKKENVHDTVQCASRYADLISARVKTREVISKLCKHSRVPIINALDDYAHPCQMLADFLTIKEHKLKGNKQFNQLKFAYFGDCKNNVTYDLMRGCALLGMDMNVSGPSGKEYDIEQSVWDEINELCKKSGAKIKFFSKAEEAAKGVDVIYTDSWMSYGIEKSEEEKRKKIFMPYQVNQKIIDLANDDVIFMNCLPAQRGMEQTAEVIDGKHSVVFDEAENRLHGQKALFLYLVKGEKIL